MSHHATRWQEWVLCQKPEKEFCAVAWMDWTKNKNSLGPLAQHNPKWKITHYVFHLHLYVPVYIFRWKISLRRPVMLCVMVICCVLSCFVLCITICVMCYMLWHVMCHVVCCRVIYHVMYVMCHVIVVSCVRKCVVYILLCVMLCVM